MIVVDASAIVAIMAREPEARDLADRLTWSMTRLEHRFASTVTLWEAACAVARLWRGDRQDGLARVREFLELTQTQAVAPDLPITVLAVGASQLYGRGPGYPGILNLGGCFSYATAKHLGAKLLYKGDDFAGTDVQAA